MTSVATDYGIFSQLVASAGSLMAMSVALLLGWKGRAGWEPSDQDVDKGAQKVGALAAGILIAFIFVELSKPEDVPTLMHLSLLSLAMTVGSLLVYGSLTTIFIYIQWQGTPEQRNIVGGLTLKADAREALNRERKLAKERGETPPTVQELFKGAAYAIDQLWSGPSRAITKGLFTLGYLGLTIGGTISVASASIAIGHQIPR
jgi:hypothetical protein